MRLRMVQIIFRGGFQVVGLPLTSQDADGFIRRFRSQEWKLRDEPLQMGTTEEGADYCIDFRDVCAIYVGPLPNDHPLNKQQTQQGQQSQYPPYPPGNWLKGSGMG